ncbi:hypothetical protein [Amycolatopsis anabasis]|uniref:hypothetical protein n=1 Tax=Amycolatopsis anabasis TaxID=1840409 RepID=UPI00131D4CA1|nr:hypothetical protein [Amycolatopsis anabasis]
MPHASPTSDPITRAEVRRAELAAELKQAAEQAEGWHAERNRLVTELVAAGASYREADAPGRLSASGIGLIVRRDRQR